MIIEWIVQKIFTWGSLRNAIFDEINLYQSIEKSLSESNNSQPSNLFWCEGDKWYGWTFDRLKNRYYFEDVGHDSLMNFWENELNLELKNG